MLNQIVLVGRLVKTPEVVKTDSDKEVSNITLAVPRSYKNINGEYETDYIDCVLWTGIAENTTEYCKKGDLLGVKGRVQTRVFETDDDKYFANTLFQFIFTDYSSMPFFTLINFMLYVNKH